jgi:hypothetical protein
MVSFFLSRKSHHCLGQVLVPRIVVFTKCWMDNAYWVKLFMPHHYWCILAPLAKSIVMIFSATLFSKWRIHGMACWIKIIAASFPSSPLWAACEIRSSKNSVYRKYISRLLRSSNEPRMLNFHKQSSRVTKLLYRLIEVLFSSSVSPLGMNSTFRSLLVRVKSVRSYIILEAAFNSNRTFHIVVGTHLVVAATVAETIRLIIHHQQPNDSTAGICS